MDSIGKMIRALNGTATVAEDREELVLTDKSDDQVDDVSGFPIIYKDLPQLNIDPAKITSHGSSSGGDMAV